MGKIVVKKIKGMNQWAKFALVTLSTLLVSSFLYESALALNLPIMHNSSTTTREGAEQKYGSWGLDKDCTWCHDKNTDNVKLVKEIIDTPNGLRTVLFTRMTASSNDAPGVLGNDGRTYAGNGLGGSANICEVCHRQTPFHKYSAVAPVHYDNQLCTTCHSHADGFKAKGGHLVPVYATAGVGHAVPSCSDATGCHANVNPEAPYPAAGSAPDCRSCHQLDDPTVVGNCASCHGDGTGNGVPVGGAAGSHPNHAAILTCSDCHLGGGSGSGVNHGMGNRGANPAFVNISSVTYPSGWNINTYTCSTASCHASSYGETTVTTPQWGDIVGCAACHREAPGEFQANGAPATGSHAIHLNLLYEGNPVVCNQCHDGAVAGNGGSGGNNHRDGDIDVTGGYPLTAKHTAGNYTGTCSTSSCHASPYAFKAISSPVWGVASGCASCHRGIPGLFQANGAPATGSHAKHLELLDGGAPVTCSHCHEGAEKGVSGGAYHLNQAVNISAENDYFGSPVPKHGAGNYAGYCQNAYCHTSPYGTGAVNSPVWGDIVGCASCHTGTGAFTARFGSPSTGSHSKHMALYNAACDQCHSGAVAGINPGNHHSNGFVNVTGGYTASPVTRHPIGTYAGTCANSCHTNGNGTQLASPRWGVAMPANCTGCHGGAANVTPSAAILNTGKHKAHMNNISTLGRSNNLKCAECHATTVSLSSNTVITNNIKHVNQFKDYSGVKAGGNSNYSVATGVCSNVYCHSTGQAEPVYSNMTGRKSWRGDAKFDCNGCHGNYPGATSYFGGPNYPNRYDGTLKTANSHERHTVIAGATDSRACAKCHVTSVDAGVANKFRNVSTTHLNMTRDVAYRYTFAGYSEVYHLDQKTCSTYCHSNVQTPGPIGGPATSYAKPAWGANNTMTCASCHVDMGALTETAEGLAFGSHRRHVASYTNQSGHSGAAYQCSICHGTAYNSTTAETPTHADGTINLAFIDRAAGTTYSQGLSNAPGQGYGTCSTSKCHGRGVRNWGISTDIPVCEKCHGSANTAINQGVFKDTGGSNTGNFAGTHVSHLAGTHNLMAPIQCSECHTVPAAFDSFDHMSSMPAKLDWGPLSTRRAIIRGYTSTTVPAPLMAPTYAYGVLGAAGTCYNNYCHSGVQIKNYSTGLITKQGNKPNPTWGDQAYLGGTGCNTCHGYPPGGTHPTGNSCSACHNHVDQSNLAMEDKTKHINGIIETTVDECLGCHSSLTVCQESDPSCINRALIAGHNTHTDAELFLYNLDSNGNIIYEPNPLPPYGMIPSKKKLSKNDYIDATWIYSISYKKGFPQYACGFCHPMDVGYHKNGVVELDLDPNHALRGSVKTKNLAGGPWVIERHTESVVCNNVYCHSSGFVSETTNQYQFKQTPDWYYAKKFGQSAWDGLDNCAQCHGNSPNTGGIEGSSAHARHVVANHFKDVFDGYSGKLAPVGIPGSGAVHGDPNTSTNFNCNICHFNTVRDAFNDLGSTCSDCHTTTKRGTMRVYSASRLHINGDVDVTFMEPFTIKSKAQLRNNISSVQSVYTSWTRVKGYKLYSSYDRARSTPQYVGGTCTTTACHNGTQMEWRTKGPLDCAACHNGLPQ